MDRSFTVRVRLTAGSTLESTRGRICQLCFEGDCSCAFFRGKILPGGVDTQYYLPGEPGLLSARYMLQGVDARGLPTKIFIDNSAVPGQMTRPVIWTDNPGLSFLETESYRGTIRPEGEALLIRFEPAEKEDVL